MANRFEGLDTYLQDRADSLRSEREIAEAEAAQAAAAEAEANKPITEKITDFFGSINYGENIRSAMGETYSNGTSYMPAYTQEMPKIEEMGDLLSSAADNLAEIRKKGAQLQAAGWESMKTGDNTALSAAVEDIQAEGGEFINNLGRAVTLPGQYATKDLISHYADDKSSPVLRPLAQYLQQTDTNLQYYMTDADQMKLARDIQTELGIPAEAIIGDKDAYKKALEVYHFKKKVENIEDVWDMYPELKDVANMSTQSAAIALHEMNAVKQTHGIIDSFLHGFGKGSDKLEYDEIQYKIMRGEATDEEKKRAEDLKARMEKERTQYASFLDAMAGGAAESLPEMVESIKEGGASAAAMAALSVAFTVATGGTGAAAIAGGAALRTAILRALGGTAAKRAFQAGMFWGMAKPEMGARFAELDELKNTDGTPLLSDDERRLYAAVGGATNAGIEMANLGLITNALKPYPHATKVFGDIVKNAAIRKSQQEKLMQYAGGWAKNTLAIAASESGEEALQSAADDAIHNYIVADKGAYHIKSYSLGEIAERSYQSAVEAFPAALGFGVTGATIGAAGRAGTAYRSARRDADIARIYGENARQTMAGTVMVEQLQQAVASGKLKEKAPDVQKKILRSQLSGTGYEMAYIDVETALKNEKGMDDLQKIAKETGMTDNELQTAIEENGIITVPTEILSQVSTTPDLLDSVSFKPEAESMARMRETQKELVKQYDKAIEEMAKRREKILETIVKENLPNATEEQKRIIREAITSNPDNPAQGWNTLRKGVQEKLDEILAPALKALNEGMGNAGLLEVEDENGNKKTTRYTENAEWYRNFYKTFHRRPTKAELEDMAVAMITGDPSAPKVGNWIPDSAEMELAMQENKGTIEAIKADLAAIDSVKASMKDMTGTEMNLTSVFEPETYKAYKKIMAFNKSVGGSTARQARAGAILSATHAQIIAKRIEKLTGKKYTAEDYVNDKLEFTIRPLQNGMNQFAGETAKNASIDKLVQAENLEKQGTSMEDIYKETGWVKGHDGKWRFEIPDNLDAVNWDVFKKGNTENKSRLLKYVYKNQKLYEAYPWLENINVEVRQMEGNTYGGVVKNYNGSYIVIKEDAGDEQKSGTLIHEIQHLIQDEEGFAVGGTDENANEQIIDRIRELNKRIQSYDYGAEYADTVMDQQEMILEGVENPEAEEMLKSQIAELEKKIPAKERDEIWQLASDRQYLREALNENTGNDYSLYRNLAGEQEARHATDRAIIHTNVVRAEKELAEKKAKYEAEKAKQSPAMKKMLDELEALREKDEKTDAEFDRIDEIRAAMDEKLMQAETFYAWAKDTLEMRRREAAETPQPHDENAIVVFGGQEMALSQEPNPDDILYQRAWHGTPHNFNVFDLGAIGTGEGAQAHGWGLYFAGNKEVSEEYRSRLTGEENIYIIDGEEFLLVDGEWASKLEEDDEGIPQYDSINVPKEYIYALDALNDAVRNDKKAAKEHLEKQIAEFEEEEDDYEAQACQDALELIDSIKIKQQGSLFEVEIPDDDVLLDEQKPFSEQPEKVQEGIRKVLDEIVKSKKDVWAIENLYKDYRIFKDEDDFDGTVNPNPTIKDDVTGKEIYDTLTEWQQEQHYNPLGNYMDQKPYKAASEQLNKYGIKGITYEGGRDGRCYVVFDDKAISIIEKYNQAAMQQYVHGQTANVNGKRIVSIMEHAADESTFMHEMAHVFLYDLQELAAIDEDSRLELEVVSEWAEWHKGDAQKLYSNTPWTREFAQREQEIIDAEEHHDYDLAERKKREWVQERFARAFELYLREGQAPSSRLKAIFRQFKEFLSRLYSAFINDGARASEPVKRVMDRMIATEDEIQAAELEDRYSDFEAAGGKKLFDETDAEVYKRWYKECEEDAKEKLLKIVMKDLEQARQEEFDTKVAIEEARKRAELRQENVYVAEQAVLASGDENIVKEWYPSVEAFQEELAITPPLEDVLREHMQKYRDNLDAELMNSHLSPETVDKVMDTAKYRNKLEALKSKAMAKKAGLINRINAKAARAMDSLEDKLKALPDDMDLKMNAHEPQIKSIMKEVNKLRFASKWTKDELGHIESMIRAGTQAEIKQALKDFKEKARQDKEQENAVMKANEGRRHLFRELAKQAATNKPIADSCNVNYYKSEARKAARRVQDMLRAGRWDMALVAQEQLGFQTAMVEIAEKNKEKMEKLVAQVKRELNAKTVRLPKDERYWHRHLAFLLRITQTDAAKPESGVKELDDLFGEMKEALDIQDVPLKILDVATRGEDFQGYPSLTLDEFKEAVDAIHILYKVGKDKFKLKTIAGKTIGEVVEEIRSESSMASASMVDAKKINDDKGGLAYSETIGNTGSIGHLLAKQGQQYILSNLKPENLINMLGEKAHKYLYGTLERAAEEEAKLQEQNIKALREIMSVYSHQERQDFTKKMYEFSTEGTDKISKENIMAMALNWGTLSNRQRLLGGLAKNSTPEAVNQMMNEVMDLFEETMTEKDWLTVQRLWDHVNSYWDMTVKVEEELNGTALVKIPPMAFTMRTADGKTVELAGGYMNIKYNPEKSSRAAEQDINKAAQTGLAGNQRLGAGRGFTKGRSEFDIFRALQLNFDVIENHLQDVIHNATYRIPVRDVYRILTNIDFENYVVEHLGRDVHNILKDWALDAWKQNINGSNTADNVISRSIAWLRSNSTMAIMGMRAWPAIENVSNLPIAIDKIGAGQMAAALAEFYPHRAENMAKIKEMSIFMRNRLENMDRDIRSQTGIFRAKNKLAEFASEHSYDLLVISDLAVSAPLWLRSYKNAYAPSLEKVKRENEANIAYVMQAQQELDAIVAEISDLKNETAQMDEHLQARRYASPETAEMLRQSPFAVHTDDNLRALSGENKKRLKELEKELWKAEVKFQEAQEIKIMSDDEIIAETERQAVYAADGVIRDTFGSGRILDQPSVQRSKNELTKLLTTFYSFFNTQFNALFMAYQEGHTLPNANVIQRWMPFAKSFMYRVVGAALIGSTLQFAMGLAGNDDDDKKRKEKNAEGKEIEVEIPAYERFLKVFAKNTLSISSGSMYFVRDIIGLATDFVLSGKSYGLNTGSVATRSLSEFGKMFALMAKKGEKDAQIQEQQEKREAAHQEKLRKLKGKKRQEYLKKWEEEQQYIKPPKRITYTEIAGHGLKGMSGLTANYTGVTSTMVNAVTSTMQYLLDTDMRYDPTMKNIIWSAIFDKKPVEREIPKKPPAEPKKKTKKSKE